MINSKGVKRWNLPKLLSAIILITMSSSATAINYQKPTTAIDRSYVEKAIKADKDYGKDNIKYISLDRFYRKYGFESLDIARYAMSKSINCSAPFARDIAHPVSIDRSGVVFKIDINDYWGFDETYSHDEQEAKKSWNIISSGLSSVAKNQSSLFKVHGPKISKLNEVVDGTDLVVNLTHPYIYHRVMKLPAKLVRLGKTT